MATMPNEFEVSVDVVAEVEFTVGEKTAAWLESLGWKRPILDERDAAEIIDVRTHSDDRPVALNGQEATTLMAKNLRFELMCELSSPERVDDLLSLCNVDVEKLAEPDA